MGRTSMCPASLCFPLVQIEYPSYTQHHTTVQPHPLYRGYKGSLALSNPTHSPKGIETYIAVVIEHMPMWPIIPRVYMIPLYVTSVYECISVWVDKCVCMRQVELSWILNCSVRHRLSLYPPPTLSPIKPDLFTMTSCLQLKKTDNLHLTSPIPTIPHTSLHPLLSLYLYLLLLLASLGGVSHCPSICLGGGVVSGSDLCDWSSRPTVLTIHEEESRHTVSG